MIPGCGIISGPGEAIALPARVGSSGENEGTLVGAQLEKALVSAARILQSNNIVNLGMRGGASHEAGFFDAVNGIQGHRLAGYVKNRGLVHIVPEAGNSVLHELLVQTAPPFAAVGSGAFGKDRKPDPEAPSRLAPI